MEERRRRRLRSPLSPMPWYKLTLARWLDCALCCSPTHPLCMSRTEERRGAPKNLHIKIMNKDSM